EQDGPAAGVDLLEREASRPEERMPGGEQRGQREDHPVLTKRSANRSLCPRRPAAAAAPGDESQSRASCELRRKSPSDWSLNPARSTSARTACSSMRCRVLASAVPVPGFALESMTTETPPDLSESNTALFILSRSTAMAV